ncbi:hypothetical protein ISF_00028 [Cordyceps fumosorosea ARSEF 2679]|uniref:COPII vesicles protein Yip3 n=1 Tax=Cordyceps fumosorosea (strain ARSEF 2679) TaxID=1081104 RepID=A0A168DXJ4_CORFA|nr:hypothetical protein ISF_00028 [Cordyceps fumosorosea ARSEF 2679]OAA73127.1 hypothetical protein ISF_00028 [Cordyceps fumosorosea ARSEF 2679]
MFGSGSRVEEVNSDDDESDGHGVGLSARRQTRFVSDSLQFTGTDLGDRSGLVRRGQRYQDSGDESDSQATSDNGESEDEDETEGSQSGNSQLPLGAREDVLVQSALKRISRAQAKGRTDVKLNKDELAALERRRKRMQEEAERAERERAARASGSSGSDRKKKHKEQRLAVPLSQFEPLSRKKRSGSSSHPPRKDSLPSRSTVGDSPEQQQVYPPMGYFPPPSQSRSRSSSHLQRPGSRAHDASNSSPPVAYHQYASGSSHRHASDSMARPHSRGLPHEDAWNPTPSLDPFQYQTEGPRVNYPASSRVGSRSEVAYRQSSQGHGTSSPATRSRHGSSRPSLSRVSDSSATSGEDTASDELGNGAQIREQQQQPPARGRSRREIVVEVEPEPALPPPPAKKKSSSPTKRKPAPNGKKKKR